MDYNQQRKSIWKSAKDDGDHKQKEVSYPPLMMPRCSSVYLSTVSKIYGPQSFEESSPVSGRHTFGWGGRIERVLSYSAITN